MKQTVTIEIAGTKYKMTSDAEPERLRRLAQNINARIADLGPAAQRSASPAQLLAMVALSLAEDLEAAEARRLRAEARIREVLNETIGWIDERLAELAAAR